MDTITLQLKRVTGNWSTHKGYIPANGEPVMIGNGVISDDSTLCIVVGDGTKNLDNLVSTTMRDHQLALKKDVYSVESGLQNTLDRMKPNKAPRAIAADEKMGEDENQYALQDHIHALYRVTVENILETCRTLDTEEYNITTDFACRRAKVGNKDPLTENIEGATVGDIYIRI